METYRDRERSAKQKKLLLFFLVGFVLGVFYIILLGHTENSNMLMSSYFFSKYQYMEYSPLDLLWYILRSRVSVMIFLWLMGLTVLGSMMILLFGFWTGFSFGLILTMAVQKLGMAGLILCLISMFPHYLIYFPALFFGLIRIYEMSQNRRLNGIYIAVLGMIMILFLGGGILESYVNPLLLKALIKKI